MRYLRIVMVVIFLMMPLFAASQARADNDRGSRYWFRSDNAPDIDIWTNKGNDATYYFGEDVAVYFKADQDCYVVVYDIDPSGDVHVLFPSSIGGSTFVRGGDVYRIPGTNDDFKLEVADNSGLDRIYAVASFDNINPPDFMRYVGYDYGNTQDYDNSQFIMHTYGNIDNFVDDIDARITSGNISVAYTNFNVDDNYRNYNQYRYADYNPYDVSSVWIGCDYPGSEIWIDGIYYGIAPVLIPSIIVGYHWAWAYYDGYPCYQQYFWVPRYHRFDLNIHVDDHFRDGRYRHDEFNRWRFVQRPVHNNPGFVKDARQLQEKSIRTRTLPSSVVRDYVDRGVMSRDNPLAKGVRTDRSIDRYPSRIIAPDRSGSGNVVIDRGGNKAVIDRGNPDSRNRGNVGRSPNSNNGGREVRPNSGIRNRGSRGNSGNNRSKMITTPVVPQPQAPERPRRAVAPAIRHQDQGRIIERGDGNNSNQNARDSQGQEVRQAQPDRNAQPQHDNGSYRQRDSSNTSSRGISEKASRNENSSRGNSNGRESRGRQR
jgi:hypothetical protein